MDLVKKLQDGAGYSENRAQEAVGNLIRIENGLSPKLSPKEQVSASFKPFLAPIESKQVASTDVCKPLARKWPPFNRVKPVIPTNRAFNPLQYESVSDIRERFGI